MISLRRDSESTDDADDWRRKDKASKGTSYPYVLRCKLHRKKKKEICCGLGFLVLSSPTFSSKPKLKKR